MLIYLRALSAKKRSGAARVLEVAHLILTDPRSTTKLAGFEERVVIRALETVLPGRGKERIYDLLLKEGTQVIRAEVKNFRIFPDDLTLFKAVDQMLKDVVEATERGAPLSNIRWFLPKFLEDTPIRQVFIDNVLLQDEILVEGLRALGRSAELPTIQRQFRDLVTEGKMFTFVPD